MFQIGEFSKIGQVSPRQLRRYDEMGLLKPLHVDRFTGYRYYSAEQLPRLNRILALKELGLSLSQIGQYLNQEISTAELRGMLALKQSQIEQQLQAEAARLRYIASRIDQIDRHGVLESDEVVLKSVPKRPFLSIRDTFASLTDGIMLMVEMKKQLTAKIKPALVGQFTAVLHSDTFSDTNLDIELGLALNQPVDLPLRLTDQRQLTLTELPGSDTMLTTVRVGPPSTGHGSFAALGIWLEANNYRLAGPGREVFIHFPPVGFAHEAVTEIQFPVARNGRFDQSLLPR